MDIKLLENERLDDLEYGNLKIIQDKNGYCFSTDAILLANFVKAKKGSKIIDIGCGSGVISILLSKKTNAEKIYGVELQEKVANLAKRNVLLNNLENVEIINEDIVNVDKIITKGSIDVICCNPPYFKKDSGDVSTNETIRLSRQESSASLEDIISSASSLLKFGGNFYMIHKAERMCDVIHSMMSNNIMPKKITLVYPKNTKAADTVIVQGQKGGASGVLIDELIVYNDDGTMTDRAKVLYNKL